MNKERNHRFSEEIEKTPKKLGPIIWGSVAVSVIVVVLVIVIWLSGQGLWLSRIFGNQGTITMLDLQMDTDVWGEKGVFKSYDDGDNVTLRDVVTSIEYHSWADVTIVYFKAKPLPSSEDFRSGNFRKESWWIYGEYHGLNSYYAPFFIKESMTSQGIEYLPEAGILIKTDITNRIHAGDTVEITLHVWTGSFPDPRKLGRMPCETIFEFTHAVPSERINKV